MYYFGSDKTINNASGPSALTRSRLVGPATAMQV